MKIPIFFVSLALAGMAAQADSSSPGSGEILNPFSPSVSMPGSQNTGVMGEPMGVPGQPGFSIPFPQQPFELPNPNKGMGVPGGGTQPPSDAGKSGSPSSGMGPASGVGH